MVGLKILVDVNISRKVYEKLKELGFDVAYVADVLGENAKDETIVKWMRRHNALILTRDKRFPASGRKKIVLATLPSEELSKHALEKLVTLRVFPRGLEDSAELNVFVSFMKELDPFFKGVRVSGVSKDLSSSGPSSSSRRM